MASWLKDGLGKLKQALFKTSSAINLSLEDDSNEKDELIKIDENFFNDLEEKFIRADIGFDFAGEIVQHLKRSILEKQILKKELTKKIKEIIKTNIKIKSFLPGALTNHLSKEEKPTIFLIVGINGSGKTTSIGKLANKFKNNNKVLIVAGDTFRAAAESQLEIWAQRAAVELYAPSDIKRPDAIVFNSIEKAKKENYDFLIIDTAGRLQSQKNLMEELKKIDDVIEKNTNEWIKEKYIVLDATIGQNAIIQAKEFSKIVNLSGIILAKLDSSSKGGVVLNIMNELSLPVKYIGTGEDIDDISLFDFDEYLNALI